MRRKASTDPNDALELFLDAISNVFGGVLFVALVVVLLLQLTVRAPAEATPPRPDDVSEQLRALESASARPAGSAEAWAAMEAERARLEAAVNESLRGADAAEARAHDAEAELRTLAAQQAEAEQAVRGAEAALEAARAQRDGLIRLPQFRSSAKREAPWLIDGGRAASLLRYDAQGRPVGVHGEVVLLHEGGQRVSLKPGAGLAVDVHDAAAVERVVRELARSLNPNEHFVSLAVWEGSFEEAAALRDALIALGFEYGLILLDDGETVATGAQGGVQ